MRIISLGFQMTLPSRLQIMSASASDVARQAPFLLQSDGTGCVDTDNESGADVHECKDCGLVFKYKRSLSTHIGSATCKTRQAEKAELLNSALVAPDFVSLRSDADHIRKLKILALGRWRYLHHLPQRASRGVTDDAETSTRLALQAYARHFKSMLSKNGIALTPELQQQIDIGGKLLIDKASTSGLSAAERDAELRKIVTPVSVHEREVGVDESGESMFVVDMKVEDTLQKMLQEKGMADHALTPHWPEEGVWREPRDGHVFKNHPLFRNDPGAFAFQLYAGE